MYFNIRVCTFLFSFLVLTAYGQNIQFEVNGNGPPTVIFGSTIQINAIVTPANPDYIYTWENFTTGNVIQTGPDSFFSEVIEQRTVYRVQVTNGINRVEGYITISVVNPLSPGFDGALEICNQTGTLDLFTILQGNPDPGGTWVPPLSGGDGIFVIGQDPIQEYKYVLDGINPFPNVQAESKVILTDCRDRDSDGDGVLDDVDLDDDNDGILDKVEGAVCSENSLIEINPIINIDFGEGFTPTTNLDVLDHEFSGIWPDDGFYCVGTSEFLGSVPQESGFPATFVMTNSNNNEDADGNVNGRYLAININSNLIDNPIYVVKDIPVEAGENYTFRIDMAGLCEGCTQVPILNLEIIDQNLPAGSPPIFSTNSDNIGIENNDVWNRVPLTFQAVNTTLLSLVIRNFQTDGNNGNDLGIDNIKFSPLTCDFDRDEIPNFLDLDSDNDGIFDIIEAGNPNVIDANNDGVADGPVDANGVPVSANGGTIPVNTDNLEYADYLDIDADNDGIQDNIEAQTTFNYVRPSGVDSDINGVDDTYDATIIIPVDTDSDGSPDYLDLNSDNDCLSDNIEAYDLNQNGLPDIVPSGVDIDFDGLDDNYDNVILNLINSVSNPTDDNEIPTDLPDNNAPGNDVDFRDDFIFADPGGDASKDICNSDDPIDLFEILGGTPEPGGTWSPTLVSGTSIFDPTIDPPGVYTYSIVSAGVCLDVSSQVTITVNEPFDLEVCDIEDQTIECDGELNETIANQWHQDNLDKLATCVNNPGLLITHNYEFTTIITTCGGGGIIPVTYSISDECGIPSSKTVTLTLEDSTPPDLETCGTVIDQSIECSGTDNETIADQWNQENIEALTNCVTDDCNISAEYVIISDYDFDNLDTTSTCGIGGTLTVNYTVADDCENIASRTVILTLEDTTGPDLSICNDVLNETIECGGDENNEEIAMQWHATNLNDLMVCAVDDCNTAAVFTVNSDFDYGNLDTSSACGKGGTLTVNYVVSDDCNNESIITAVLTLEDTTGPQLVTSIDPSIAVVCSEVSEVPELEFTDGCTTEDIIVSFEEINGDLGDGEDYQVIRTWTVTDSCGNTEVYSQTIDVTNELIVNDRFSENCYDDGTIDLFTFLPSDTNTFGEWIIVSSVNSSIEVIDGVFDPTSLDQEDDLGDYVFSYTVSKGYCIENTEVTIRINDECIVLPCGLQDFKISKTITPNGDQFNQFFEVASVKDCGFNINLKIFNRYGTIVYQNKDYQNNWSGDSHGSSIGGADQLPNGSYYYVIVLEGSGFKPLSGALFIGTK